MKIGLQNTGMINVICVKWGDKYNSKFVNRLYRMVSKNLSYDFRFFCYTDDETGIHPDVNIIRIGEDNELEAWWNKLTLFQEGMFEGTCLFFDLDVVIQNNIDSLIDYLDESCLTKVKCYWKDEQKIRHSIDPNDPKSSYDMTNNSSVMLWKADNLHCIYDHFIQNEDYYMIKYRGIDRFIVHEGFDVKTFDRGLIYSRLFGFDERNGGVRVHNNKYQLYKDESYLVCIFNGYSPSPNPSEGTHIDDTAYEGFEHYYDP